MIEKSKTMKVLILIFAVAILTACCTPKQPTVVEQIGDLKVIGNKLTDKNGNPVALNGMSLFWSQIKGKYYNADCVTWLRDDWNCTVVRAAMGIEVADEIDGYLKNPEKEKQKIFTVIDACIDLGIYVVVDWHDHHAHNNVDEAVLFFKEVATKYGNKPNVIYEIYNEPMQVSWDTIVKPYSEKVISEIRKIDPDNLIIVGTPTWAQDVDLASANPVKGDNLIYSLHFYASSHTQDLREKANKAIQNNAALFVSEFGVCEYTGNGNICENCNTDWFNFMKKHNLSWCNWAIGDKDESCAALVPGANPKGGWNQKELTKSGKMVRKYIREANSKYFLHQK